MILLQASVSSTVVLWGGLIQAGLGVAVARARQWPQVVFFYCVREVFVIVYQYMPNSTMGCPEGLVCW